MSNSAPARLSSEHPILQKLLAQYIENLPRHVANITQAVENADLLELKRLLHQLKGSGASYGFPQITQLARTAEAAVIESAPLEQVIVDVQSLIEQVRSVQGYELAREK